MAKDTGAGRYLLLLFRPLTPPEPHGLEPAFVRRAMQGGQATAVGRVDGLAAGLAYAQAPQLRDVALSRGLFHGIRQGGGGRLGGHSSGGCCACRVL